MEKENVSTIEPVSSIPSVPDTRSRVLGVKLSDAEYRMLQSIAGRYQTTISEYARCMVLAEHYAKVIERRLLALPPELRRQDLDVFLIGKVLSDALRAVDEAEQTLQTLRKLLAPGLLEIKRVIDELDLMPPEATKGST